MQKDPGNKRPICIPYYYLRTAINEKRLCLYDKCDLLTDELLNLERKADGHIDHPTNGSKDQADAVCGACFAAGKFSNEYSYDYGDNLAATLSANETDDIANNAAKLTEMFQKELAQLYSDAGLNSTGTDEATVEQKEQIDSYQNYLDIMDGILVL